MTILKQHITKLSFKNVKLHIWGMSVLKHRIVKPAFNKADFEKALMLRRYYYMP